jgi:hypothetical protein
MMLREQLSCEAAYKKVHSVRPQVEPNAGFWRQLRDLEAVLREQGVELRELQEGELSKSKRHNVEAAGGASEAGGAVPPSVGSSRRTKMSVAFTTSGANEEDPNEMIKLFDARAKELKSFVSIALTSRIEVDPNGSTSPEVVAECLREYSSSPLVNPGIVITDIAATPTAAGGVVSVRVQLVASRKESAMADVRATIEDALDPAMYTSISVEG